MNKKNLITQTIVIIMSFILLPLTTFVFNLYDLWLESRYFKDLKINYINLFKTYTEYWANDFDIDKINESRLEERRKQYMKNTNQED